jgi:hypothetical protein
MVQIVHLPVLLGLVQLCIKLLAKAAALPLFYACWSMLDIYFMKRGFIFSGPGMEDALYEIKRVCVALRVSRRTLTPMRAPNPKLPLLH